MVPSSAFVRTAEKITNYINRSVDLAGAKDGEEVLALFEKIQLLFPQWIIMTCPAMHPEILYASSNSESVIGYSSEFLKRSGGIPFFLSRVHEDDQPDLHDCYAFTHDFTQEIDPASYAQYRVIYHYRFQKRDGSYIYVHDEKAVMELPGSGKLYYLLLRDVTQERSFPGVKVEIFRQDTTLHKIREHRPGALRNPLSKREGELVMLIGRGLSTKEIAGHLHISHHTVRNIKSKLFEKYNVNNSIELLNMVR